MLVFHALAMWDSAAQVNKPKPLPTKRVATTSPVAELHTAETGCAVKVTDIESLRAFVEQCKLSLVGKMVIISIFEKFSFTKSEYLGTLTGINISGEDALELTLNCGGKNKTISLQLPKDAGKWIHITSDKLFLPHI